MKTRFLLQGIAISPSEKKYILKRLAEIEDLFHKTSLFEIELARDKKGFFRVEVNVRDLHALHRAEETSKSIEGSIDMVIGKLRTHIVKEKGKRRDLHERGARSIKKMLVVDAGARF